MAKQNLSHHPTICYRPIQPCDLEILERIHADIFPIRLIASSNAPFLFLFLLIFFLLVLICNVFLLLLYGNAFLLSGTSQSFSKVLSMNAILFLGLQLTAANLMVTVMSLLVLLLHGLCWQKKLRWVFYFFKGHCLHLCITQAYLAFTYVMQQLIKDIASMCQASYNWITQAHVFLCNPSDEYEQKNFLILTPMVF